MGTFRQLADRVRLPLQSSGDPGFREAQLGAIHAVCGHFWDNSRPALVVMPTGSGKTAVMLAVSALLRASRVLVVAPSRLLREQLAASFRTLKVLRDIGALVASDAHLKVCEVKRKLKTKKAWAELREEDAVVGTPASISPGIDGVYEPPTDMFDLVIFDEAHHVPAATYTAIADAFPAARQVLFTATPFRRDEREIRADLVFAYSLARARQDGVFGTLRFEPVEPHGEESSDQAIATAAAARVAEDRAHGLAHRLVVRASSRARADELARLYEELTTLKLKRVHSGLSDRYVRKTIDELRAGTIDGVVAVDMLGEGFDLPELKVAALHSPHRSLAITLQFIGRFARTTGHSTGAATFFAVPDEVSGEAERLFVPGAEWNEIVEDLSRERLAVERETRATLGSFEALAEFAQVVGARESQRAQIWSLRPYFHAKVYDALQPVNLDAEPAMEGFEPLLVQRSQREHAVLWIGREKAPVRWSSSEAWVDVSHELCLIMHAPDQNLVFVCSTRRNHAVYDDLIGSVTTGARRLAPDEIRRVLGGIDNQELFSLGMRNRAGVGGHGAESYRILSGRSADKAIRAADAATYDQGHAFCRGSESGKNVTMGFSSGSKVWTNRWDRLPALLDWLRAVAVKLRDTQNRKPSSMFDKLGTATRITSLPRPIIAGDLPPGAYTKGSSLVRSNGKQAWLVDLEVAVLAQTATSADLQLQSGELCLGLHYDLQSRPQFAPDGAVSGSATITDAVGRHDEPLLAFLNEQPPIFYLQDLSVVAGDTRSAPPTLERDAMEAQFEAINWIAEGVDPCLEKPRVKTSTKTGASQLSLFEYVEARAKREGAAVVFADDGTNEIADYVVVYKEPTRTRVQLVHCKATKTKSVPTNNVEDLYEVLGQAVKCRRWLDARRLLAQVRHRDRNTRSHFIVGDLQTLSALLDEVPRLAFEVVVVQPGLSTEPKDTILDLLCAADAYHRGADRLPLRMWATRPA